MKKFRMIAAALALVLALPLTACGQKESESTVYSIGISQYGEHASLDNCRIGFLQGLEEAGLVEGTDFTVDYQNAGFDDNIARQIGDSFSAADVDLMVAIATPSAVACYAAAENKDIPVIFTAINESRPGGLDSGNVTGTSDALPVEAQLQLIRQLQPEAKTIGILYTTSEPNSVSTIAEYQEKAPDYGFTIDAVGVTSQAEVTQAADTLLSHGVDAMVQPDGQQRGRRAARHFGKANEAGVPIYGSEVEQVKLGCVASAGIDYVQLGKQTGLMARQGPAGRGHLR